MLQVLDVQLLRLHSLLQILQIPLRPVKKSIHILQQLCHALAEVYSFRATLLGNTADSPLRGGDARACASPCISQSCLTYYSETHCSELLQHRRLYQRTVV